MKLPRHPALAYTAVAVLAYLSGELSVAVLENQFIAQPPRVQSQNTPVAARLDGLTLPDELAAVLTSRSSGGTEPGAVGATGIPGGMNGTVSTVPGQVSAGNATALPVLAGTLEGQGQSLAVLQSGQETQVVAVGEEWMGYKVIEVGSFEARLRDARNQEFTISMQLAGAANNTAPAPTGPMISGQIPVASPTAAPTGPPTKRELRAIMDDRGWVRNILVQPVIRNEETVGVQVNYSNPNNPFPRLGILSGDIVMSLNNKPIKGATDMGDIVNELRNADSLNFKIERNGQPIDHAVNLLP